MTTSQTDHSRRWINLLSWLLPITYLIHVVEEYWGGEGYPAYLLRIRGVHLSPTRFWVAQIIGTVLMITGIILSRRLKFPRVMLVIIGSTIMINGLTHSITSIIEGTYGPGLFSSLFFWIPLGLATLIYLRNRCIKWKYWVAIGIGLAVNIMIGVIAMRGAKVL